jgi:hypothetical protein
MSELINADFSEVQQSEQEQPSTNRAFRLHIEFTPEGVQMQVNTNLSPLEQLGAIELWKTNVLDEITGKKKSED